MKKIFLSLLMAIAAISGIRAEVAGQYNGQLLIGGSVEEGGIAYDGSSVLLFPGSDASHVNFVLPDFAFEGLELGDIVLINVPLSASGALSLTGYPLFMDALQTRVGIDINAGSIATGDSVSVLLTIDVPDLGVLPVTFNGRRLNATTYQLRNAGFEEWETEEVNGSGYTGSEPTNWNSFIACDYALSIGKSSAVVSTKLVQGTAHTGNYSALIKSSVVKVLTYTVKANGNLTTGRIHAGNISASNAANYNYTDADNDRFNAPFTGHPDAISLWIKNQPVTGSNSYNGSVKAIIHSSGDYKDPAQPADTALEVGMAQNAEIGTLADFTKLTIPFTYAHNGKDANGNDPAFLLLNITTNATPGGGNATTNSVDQMWVDDISLVYNSTLASLSVGGTAVSFDASGNASLATPYDDETLTVAPATASAYASSYVGFDPYNSQLVVIVKGEDYAQDASSYHTYTVSLQPQLSVAEEITLQQYKHKTVDVSVNGIEAGASFTWEAMQGIVTADAGIITAGKQLGDDEVILYKGEMGSELTVHVVEQPALTVSEALALCASLENGAVLPDGKYLIRGYLQQAAGSGYVVGNSVPSASAPARAAAASSEVISVPSAEVLNNAGNEPTAAGQRVELVGELTRTSDGSIALTGASILGIDERNWPTGIEQTDSTGTAVRKVLINGQLLILKGDKVYNALGQEM